jgi:hypothetical protein
MTKATDAMRAANKTHGHTPRGYQSKEYRAWRAMLARCYNPKNKDFHNYGGRGIAVCDDWRGGEGFKNFLNDIGSAPSPHHTIDRINPNDNYWAVNCRWATGAQQASNRRNTVKFLIDGKSLTLKEVIAKSGIDRTTYYFRLRKGEAPLSAATRPVERRSM